MEGSLSVSNSLPLELLQAIISYHSTDRKLLFALSLVCSTWRTATLPLLFPEANISDPSDFVHWNNLIRLSPEIATHCVRSIIYEPGMSFLGRGLASLSVEAASSDDTILHGVQRAQATEPWEPFLPLPPMPKLTSLKWAPDRRRAVRVTPALRQYLTGFPSLTRLILHAQFENLHELCVFLSLCGRLESLVLNVSLKPPKREAFGTMIGRGRNDDSTSTLEPIRSTPTPDLASLSQLVFDHSEATDAIINTILSGRLKSKTLSLRELSIHGTLISTHAFGAFLEAVASTLETFMVNPSRTIPCLPPSTLTLPNLHTLILGPIHLKTTSHPRLFLAWSSQFVTCLSSSSLLKTLIFKFTLEDPEEFDWDRWPTDQLMSMRIPEELDKLVIQMTDSPDELMAVENRALERLIRARFPVSDEKLTVEWVW